MTDILIETEGNTRIIFLNRPDKYNSFHKEMAISLQNALDEAALDDRIRCIYLTGKGKAFCAGQDLSEAIEDNGIELPDIVQNHYNPIILKIRTIEKPIVCAVNGVAAGAGANIALACDIVIAHEQASFIQAFSKIGLIPDSGGTFFLPRLIGPGKSSAYMFLADAVPAAEAERIGMIYRVCSQETFEEESKKIAHRLANMPTRGIGLTKKLLNLSWSQNLEQQLEAEKRYQTEAGNTYDYQEGVRAFLEKRKPEFRGN